ncbi:MAG: GntR family transcriptional regulator [Oscillospiraceae bacterium]|nr:GntR family transcriptional regulator [Oscillospiraceae bacterium]
MQPTFDTQKPLFLSIAQWLEDAILAGIYPEEGQVPSITEISMQYNMNPATALKGVNMLVDSGLLYKKRGLGMFVTKGARAQLLHQRHHEFFDDYIRPLVNEAKRLEIENAKLKEMIERGYQHDN